MKCLIIDDDKFERDGLVYLLRQMGFGLEFIDVKNGRLGLEVLAKENIDIVITDIKMPVMDGMTFLEKANVMKPDAAYIIYSGYIDFVYAKQALSLNVLDFLVKPVDEEELDKVIRQALAAVQGKRQAEMQTGLNRILAGQAVAEAEMLFAGGGRLILLGTDRDLMPEEWQAMTAVSKRLGGKAVFFQMQPKRYVFWCDNLSEIFSVNIANELIQQCQAPARVIVSVRVKRAEEIRRAGQMMLELLREAIFLKEKTVLLPDMYLKETPPPLAADADVGALIEDWLALGLAGHPFFAPDMIGGGEVKDLQDGCKLRSDIFLAHCQAALLMPSMQFSVLPSQVPNVCEELHSLLRQREEYLPYIMELFGQCSDSKEPMVRLLEYEFPQAGFGRQLDSFMLGDRYLVVPVTKENEREKEITLPPGNWLLNGERLSGGRTVTLPLTLERLTVLRREYEKE